MRKSTIIATCLINSGFRSSIVDTEAAIESTFREEFPQAEFDDWNSDVNDREAEEIIKAVGKASMINVRRFIEDLWKE